jgi:hypothetical protein
LPFLPLPTFSFGASLALLLTGIILLLCLSPLALRGNSWLRIGSQPLAIVVGVINTALHIASSVYFHRWMPGVYSSPFSAGSGDFFAASFACPPGTSAPVDPIRPQVHFHELEVDIPVGRHCAVPAGVHRIAECMQNRLSRLGHPVRAEVVFAGKPVHRSSRHRGQEIRPSGRTTYPCYRSAEAAAAVRSARPAYGRRPAVDRHAGRTWRTIRALLW